MCYQFRDKMCQGDQWSLVINLKPATQGTVGVCSPSFCSSIRFIVHMHNFISDIVQDTTSHINKAKSPLHVMLGKIERKYLKIERRKTDHLACHNKLHRVIDSSTQISCSTITFDQYIPDIEDDVMFQAFFFTKYSTSNFSLIILRSNAECCISI